MKIALHAAVRGDALKGMAALLVLGAVFAGAMPRTFADDGDVLVSDDDCQVVATDENGDDITLCSTTLCSSSDRTDPCACDSSKGDGEVGAACKGSCKEYNCTCNVDLNTNPRKKQCLPESLLVE